MKCNNLDEVVEADSIRSFNRYDKTHEANSRHIVNTVYNICHMGGIKLDKMK